MTPQEWTQKEENYERLVKDIVIMPDISETDIKVLISHIDNALTEAYFDYARAKTAYENSERREKTLTRDYLVMYKNEGCSERIADAQAVYEAETENIYYILNETRRRFNFMTAVLNTLNAKREMLITDSGILKLEASLIQ